MAGKIIIVNGASSSGKSSLVKELQSQCDEPYIDAGLDKFILSLPKRYLNEQWNDVLGRADRPGDMGHRLASGMHHAIVALSVSGLNVVADHVLIDSGWVSECAALFRELPAFLVGLQCPLDVLEQREAGRKDRTLGQAALQHLLVHKFTVYDIEFDTSQMTADRCAAATIDYMDRHAPQAFRNLYRSNNDVS